MPPSPLTPRWHRSRRTTTATFSLLAALVSVVSAVSSIELATAPAAGAASWGPVHAGDFPDPSILQWNGSYYAFATQNFAAASQTINIQESTSPDGVNWTPLPGRGRAAHRRCLGQAGRHLGAERRLQRQRVRHVLLRHGSDGARRPVHRCRHLPHSDWALYGQLVCARRLPGRRLLLTDRRRELRREHRPGHLHQHVHGQLMADLEERRQPRRREHHHLVRPAGREPARPDVH